MDSSLRFRLMASLMGLFVVLVLVCAVALKAVQIFIALTGFVLLLAMILALIEIPRQAR